MHATVGHESLIPLGIFNWWKVEYYQLIWSIYIIPGLIEARSNFVNIKLMQIALKLMYNLFCTYINKNQGIPFKDQIQKWPLGKSEIRNHKF